MYIKRLLIDSEKGIIRDINFKIGLNLIVDNTPIKLETNTGNNVGKTTVLQLIDFCLGGNLDKLVRDKESKNTLNNIKNFLINENVKITLVLGKELLNSKNDIIITRNFLLRKDKIIEINGENFSNKSKKLFLQKLADLLIGINNEIKPSFRQIIAHNIRYSDERIFNTLKILGDNVSLSEYEILHLFMFGFSISYRKPLLDSLKNEKKLKLKLLEDKDVTELELQLNIIEDNIKNLQKEKESLVINEDYEDDIGKINIYKLKINKLSRDITELKFRRNLLIETKEEIESDYSNIDINLLEKIYNDATEYTLEPLKKTFEKMVKYHNEMIFEKIRFVTEDIPHIENKIFELENILEDISEKKKILEKKVKKSNTFQDLEKVIDKLNQEYQKKGEIEERIFQLKKIEEKIEAINEQLKKIDNDIFTEKFNLKLKERLTKFNFYFSKVSKELYNEEYGITFEIKKDKQSNKSIYTFKCFNNNVSSGKKQGEIICFDLAYILFARDFNIPHVDFILNDKKELMFGSQIIKICEFAKNNNIQIVFSILRDKIPQVLDNSENIILELTQDDKLFKF